MRELKVSKNSFDFGWISAIEEMGRHDWYEAPAATALEPKAALSSNDPQSNEAASHKAHPRHCYNRSKGRSGHRPDALNLCEHDTCFPVLVHPLPRGRSPSITPCSDRLMSTLWQAGERYRDFQHILVTRQNDFGQ